MPKRSPTAKRSPSVHADLRHSIEILIRVLIVETAYDNRVFRWLHSCKRKLAARFEQIEIYVTVTEILPVI